MKILSVKQMREADTYTMANEPIASIELMERAAEECLHEIRGSGDKYKIFCGLGNNGGDGLAIGRLFRKDYDQVEVYIIQYSDKCSKDFLINEKKYKKLYPGKIHDIKSKKDFPKLRNNDVVIDAIFGTGLSKPTTGLVADVIKHINSSEAKVISIDMPSGLFANQHTPNESEVIEANRTLTLQSPKLAFFFPENAERVGEWEVLDIGLDEKFIDELPLTKKVITEEEVKSFLKPRKKFSHKGDYGHALLIAGGNGKMGAAVLAAKACLRTGAGLTTLHVPKCGYEIIQSAVPEAMASIDINENYFSDSIEAEKYSAIGVGPGIGTEESTQAALKNLLLNEKKVPLVLDADALNTIGLNKDWLRFIPLNSILTPHRKEFERMTYKPENDFALHELQIEFSITHKVFVILKGAYTCITTPAGEAYFNNTGNPGMAKGGSGDVLTGILTGLLAQSYLSLEASLLGVYLHGLAGDIAENNLGKDGMIASDIIDSMPEVWMKLRKKKV